MFNLLNAKRERNYHVVKAAMEIENIDTEERAKEAIKLTFANGKQGTIVAVLVFAILLLLFPQARSMVLALGAVILAWIWGSVLNGRKQILRYIKEEINGNKPAPVKKETDSVKAKVEEAFDKTEVDTEK